MPRFHVDLPLASGATFCLPPGAARHAQVRRLQPGDRLTLFNGAGGEWAACITRMGRSEVQVTVNEHRAVEREAAPAVHLACGLMAAERMDWLAEKATELGAASLQPVLTQRSTLRLSAERADKKRAHWQAVAAAACEQSGRNRLLHVYGQQPLSAFLAAAEGARLLLSLDADATPVSLMAHMLAKQSVVTLLSGPEGGLSPEEVCAARAAGFAPISLGPRVLRAETAPLAALAVLLMGVRQEEDRHAGTHALAAAADTGSAKRG